MRFVKLIGAILLGGGIMIVASSFLVELTVFSDDPGLGFRQIAGIVTGSGAAIVGMVLLLGRGREHIVLLRLVGIALLAGGSAALLASLLIDFAGFRTSPGFGMRQIGGAITGAVTTLLGGLTLFKVKVLAG